MIDVLPERTHEKKAADKIEMMLHELHVKGFNKQESFSLLGLAFQLAREEAGK